jgi:KRAB domain-containing zinc finger protein
MATVVKVEPVEEFNPVVIKLEPQNCTATPKVEPSREFMVILKKGSKRRKVEVKLEKDEEQKKDKLQCQFCNKQLTSRPSLIRHMRSFHLVELNMKLLECDFCGLKLKFKNSLTKHMNAKHEGGRIEQFICDHDGKSFDNRHKFLDHMRIHRAAKSCKICGDMVKYMKIHMKTHDKNLQNKCQHCSYATHSKRTFELHLRTHDNNRVKDLKCPYCDLKTDRKGDLKVHIETHNPNRTKFPCPACDYEATKKANLKAHIKIHDENRVGKFQCQLCNFKTNKKSHLTRHFMSHKTKLKV